MDTSLVAQVSEAAVVVGTYLGATSVGGVVQGASFESVKALIGWFRGRGVEPESAWQDAGVAAGVPARLQAVTEVEAERLVWSDCWRCPVRVAAVEVQRTEQSR